MKENIFKATLTVATSALCVYFQQLIIPIVLLLAVMIIDYATGMAKAYIAGELSSRVGIKGIIKKVGYLVIVAVGMCVDWLLQDALVRLGVDLKVDMVFALLVTVWLIINELISVLENVAAMGTVVPGFIEKLLSKLKTQVEKKADVTGAEKEKEASEDERV